MSGVLALIGGGEWSEGCRFDAELLEAAGTDEVVVIPAGAAFENPSKALTRARTWFDALGASVMELPVLTRPDALVADTAERLAAARFIYLAGGSAMHLRSVLKDTPVYDALVGAWRGGAVLAGSGAGADVLCDPMVDARGGALTVGLGLLTGMAVIPRADTWSAEKVHRTVAIAPPDLALVALPERTAVLRAPDGVWRADGVGTPTVYRDGRVVSLSELPG